MQQQEPAPRPLDRAGRTLQPQGKDVHYETLNIRILPETMQAIRLAAMWAEISPDEWTRRALEGVVSAVNETTTETE